MQFWTCAEDTAESDCQIPSVKLHVEVRSIRRSWTFLKLLFAMLHTYSMPLNSGWYGTFHTIEKPNELACATVALAL